MRNRPWLLRGHAWWMLISAVCAVTVIGSRSVNAARPSVSEADTIMADLEATSARESQRVESFTTSKTFTIMHEGETRAEVVAALRFTAPDVKTFAVTEARGSDFLVDRVIRRMMQSEVDLVHRDRRSEVAFSAANYEFPRVEDDGDVFVIDTVPRRRDELLIRGRVWITKDGWHLKRIEGEPASNPSMWTRKIHFVSEYAPVDGVWLHKLTVATVSVRWFGEYVVRSECGPYQLLIASETQSANSGARPGSLR